MTPEPQPIVPFDDDLPLPVEPAGPDPWGEADPPQPPDVPDPSPADEPVAPDPWAPVDDERAPDEVDPAEEEVPATDPWDDAGTKEAGA